MSDEGKIEQNGTEKAIPIGKFWQALRNSRPFILLLVLFLINCWYSPAWMHEYVQLQMEHFNVEISISVIRVAMANISYAAALITGILADNFLGRYQCLQGSMALMAVSYLGVALGGMPVYKIGYHGLGVASVFLKALLLGSLRASLLPFLGDQTTGDRQRLVAFACVYPVYRLAFLASDSIAFYGGILRCGNTDLCHILPNILGCLACASMFCCFMIWKKEFIRQTAFHGNVLKAFFKILSYSIMMRFERASHKNSLLNYAKDLDLETAEYLIRIAKTLFLMAVNAAYLLYDTGAFMPFMAFQDSSVFFNRNPLMLSYNGELIAGTFLLICIILFPKAFSVTRALILSTILIGLSTTALVTQDVRRRSAIFDVPKNHIRLGVFNLLNSSVLFESGENEVQIPANSSKAFTIKVEKGTVKMVIQPPSLALNSSKQEIRVVNNSDAAIIQFHSSAGKYDYQAYDVDSRQRLYSTKVITSKSEISILKVKLRTIVKNGQRSNDSASHYVWHIGPPHLSNYWDKAEVKIGISRNLWIPVMIAEGEIHAVTEYGGHIYSLKLVPSYKIHGSTMLDIALVLNALAKNLFFLMILEFTYSQAPSHMRALLQGLIFSSFILVTAMDKLLNEFILMMTRKEKELASLLIKTAIALLSMSYGAWKFQKIGINKAEPVEMEENK